MNESTALLLALIALLAEVNTPSKINQVNDYIWSQAQDYSPVNKTGAQPEDIGGVGAAIIAAGANHPYWLEIIWRRVQTYPYYRSGTSGEVMHHSGNGPWG